MGVSRSVSSFGLKVLQKLASGAKGRLIVGGGLIVGQIRAPKSLVSNLMQEDLLTIWEDETVLISDVGRAFLRRQRGPNIKRRRSRLAKQAEDFSVQHKKIVKQEFRIGKRKEHLSKNIGGSPLAWLMQRRDREGHPFITRDHFEAGEQLCRDYEYGGLIARTINYYDGVPISGKRYYSGAGDNPTVIQLAAKRRVDAALDFVGPGLSDVLVRVCCYQEGLEQAEKNLAWPNRSAKLVLRFALERLVAHYNPKK